MAIPKVGRLMSYKGRLSRDALLLCHLFLVHHILLPKSLSESNKASYAAVALLRRVRRWPGLS